MTEPVDPDLVATVRRFTRFYTERVNLLGEGLLQTEFSLPESRVIYEVATADDVNAAGLARVLGVDPGYLSRVLKRLEARGIVSRSPSAIDGRSARLALTEAGRAAFAELDAQSDREVENLLAACLPGARPKLAAAMAQVERLLGGGEADPAYLIRPYEIGDLGWIARRQGQLYAAEYGFDATFEALVAEIAAAFVKDHDPARERAWIAERHGEVVGSVFLVRAADAVAKLRLLYVEPDARGLGIGRRLTDECVRFARARGYRTLTLWTNDVLHSAIRIYRAAGFRLVSEDHHRSFGKDLVGQTWSLDL